jgi:hypothetical protein
MDKKESRLRRGRQTRIKIAQLGVNRLSVHRTNLTLLAYQQDFPRRCGGLFMLKSMLVLMWLILCHTKFHSCSQAVPSDFFVLFFDDRAVIYIFI